MVWMVHWRGGPGACALVVLVVHMVLVVDVVMVHLQSALVVCLVHW